MTRNIWFWILLAVAALFVYFYFIKKPTTVTTPQGGTAGVSSIGQPASSPAETVKASS